MKFLRFIIIMFIGAVITGAVAYYAANNYYTSGREFSGTKTVIIKKGSGVGKIASQLEEAGVIYYPKFFTVAAKYTKQTSPHYGEYEFTSGMSPKDILAKLQNGETVIRKITIPEGRTSYEALQIIAASQGLEGTLPESIEEGSILPTTYHYQWGDRYEDVIRRMQNEMKKTITELWPNRQPGLPITTPEQAIVLASIVEEETGPTDEQPLVASVFINRLNKGMKLESDPTAVYGITKGAPLGRMPLRKDIQNVNEYNTYLIAGLPPKPITNPGRKAIEAVLNPAESDFIFFVATGTGGHNFSRTLDEHNKFVSEYRKVLRGQAQPSN